MRQANWASVAWMLVAIAGADILMVQILDFLRSQNSIGF